MSNRILRILDADYITEAIFQITALGATKKKAFGLCFLDYFFSKITKDFNRFIFFNKYSCYKFNTTSLASTSSCICR